MSNLEEGTYQYLAQGVKGSTQIGTDRGQFSVGKSNIEHFRLRADNNLLQQVALRTEGKFVAARDIASLSDDILQLNTLKPVVDYKKSRIGFHEFAWIFILLLLLLTAEWVTRKVYSLV